MPSSEIDNLQIILELARAIKPKAVLDVGIGTGKYGLLFRDYLDGHWVGHAFHDPKTWKMTMIGIEIFKEYVTPVHEYLYDEIVIADAFEYFTNMNHLGHFDLIFMGDVLEHFPMGKGKALIDCFRDKWLREKGHLIISTPNFDTLINDERRAIFGNHNEVHRCRWTTEDFAKLIGFKIVAYTGKLLTVDMQKL